MSQIIRFFVWTGGVLGLLFPSATAQNALSSSLSAGGEQEKCYAWKALSVQERRQLEVLESAIAPILERYEQQFRNPLLRNSTRVLEIPVVFHVVYSGGAPPVSTSQIYAQLDTLNQMFRFRNALYANLPDYFASVAADTRIEFCLATRDPQGNPTSGIVYRQTSVSCFQAGTYDERRNSTGGSSAWPPDQYLNIWIVDLCGGVLGYASFPSSLIPGVTVDYATLPGGSPPFHQGKTLVHELGHSFGLRHIWGDDAGCGDDKVEDTPPVDGPTTSCPSFPSPVTCAGRTWTSRMFVNHMDYSYDVCLKMFTAGQAARMRAFLEAVPYLHRLTHSSRCFNASRDIGVVDILFPRWTVCQTTFSPVVVIKNHGTVSISSAVLRTAINGTIAQTDVWTGTLSPEDTTGPIPLSPVSVPPDTVVRLCVWTELPNGSPDEFPFNDTACIEISTPMRCGWFSGFERPGTNPGMLPVGLPGPRWYVQNPDLDIGAVSQNDNNYAWTLAIPDEITGSSGTPTYSAFMQFWWYNRPGARAHLISRAIDLRNVPPWATIQLELDYAYAVYQTSADSLIVSISTDCGQTWIPLWAGGGSSLQTASASGEFFPSSSADWNTLTIDLSAYRGQVILLRFTGVSDYGNNLFLDNIRVRSSACAITGTEETGNWGKSSDALPDWQFRWLGSAGEGILTFPDGALAPKEGSPGEVLFYDMQGRLLAQTPAIPRSPRQWSFLIPPEIQFLRSASIVRAVIDSWTGQTVISPFLGTPNGTPPAR